MEVVEITIKWDDGSVKVIKETELNRWLTSAKIHSFIAIPPDNSYEMAPYWPVWIKKGEK